MNMQEKWRELYELGDDRFFEYEGSVYPMVSGGQIITGTATLTAQNPVGTDITTPVTTESFFIRIRFTVDGGFGDEWNYLEQQNNVQLAVTGDDLSLVSDNVSPVGIESSRWTGSSADYFREWSIPVTLAGSGTGTVGMSFPFRIGPTSYPVNITPTPETIAINLPIRPIVTIGSAESPVGVTAGDPITSPTFSVDFTWDRNVSAAFTQSDINASSSNTNMPISITSFENIGTTGTTTHFRAEFSVTGTGISTITLTVPAGAIPTAGAIESSRERTRTYSINTFPYRRLTIGPASESGWD